MISVVDIIDTAGVEIVAVISKDFNSRVKAGVAKALAGVDKQIKASLRPITKTIEDGVVTPFERAGTRVTAAARVAGRGIAAGVGAGLDDAGREIDRFIARAESELDRVSGSVDLDTATAQADLDRFVARNGDRRIEISVQSNTVDGSVDLDTSTAQAAFEDFLSRNSGRDLDVSVKTQDLTQSLSLDTASAQAALEQFLASNSGRDLDISIKTQDLTQSVSLNTTAAQIALDRFIAKNSDRNIEVSVQTDNLTESVSVDTTAAQAALDAFLARNAGRDIDIAVRTDRSVMDTAFTRISSALDGVGRSASGATSAIRPLYVAIAAAATASIPLVGALVQASGALIPLTVNASSLALGFAAVKVGSLGVSDAIKAQSKAQQELAATGEVSAATQESLDAAMKSLAPAARALVKEVSAISPAWSSAAKATQQALFKGTAPLLARLSDTYLPTIRKSLVGVAGDFSKFAASAVDSVTKASTVAKVGDFLESLRTQLSDLVPAFGNIGAAIATFFGASTGSAEGLAVKIREVSETFRAFATRVTSNGSFQSFLDGATTAAGAIISAFTSVGSVIGTILGSASDVGVQAFGAISETFDALNAQLSSPAGKAALEGFFQVVSTVVGAISDTIGNLGPVFAGLGDIFAAIEKPVARLRAALEPITEAIGKSLGDALSGLAGPLATIVDGFAGFLEKIAPIADKIAPIVLAIAALFPLASGITAISGAFAGVSAALAALASPIGVIVLLGAALVVAYQKSSTFRDTVQQAFAAIKVAVTDAIAVIRPALEDLISTIQTSVLPALQNLWMAFKPIVDFILTQVVPVLIKLYSEYLANGLIPVLKFLAEALAFNVQRFADFINKVVEGITQIVNFVQTVIAKFNEFKAKIVEVVEAVKAKFAEFRAKVGEIIAGVRAVLETLIGKMVDVRTRIGAVITAIKGFFDSMREKISNVVGNVRDRVGDIADKMKDVRDKIKNFIDDIKGFFDGLVNKSKGLGAAIGGNIADGLRGAVNSIIGGINSVINAFNALPGPNIRTVGQLANGAIIKRSTIVEVGEAGPEVVLPLVQSRINRTLSLLRESGLLDRPEVQRAVFTRARVPLPVQSTGSRVPMTPPIPVVRGTIADRPFSPQPQSVALAPAAMPAPVSTGGTRTVNTYNTINVTSPLVDPTALARSIVARIPGISER